MKKILYKFKKIDPNIWRIGDKLKWNGTKLRDIYDAYGWVPFKDEPNYEYTIEEIKKSCKNGKVFIVATKEYGSYLRADLFINLTR